MPGLKVFIKGLNKTVEFPADTPMEVIEQSIKSGWIDIERMAGATVGLGALSQSDDSEAGLLGKAAKQAFIDSFAEKNPKAIAKVYKKTGKKDIDRIYAAVKAKTLTPPPKKRVVSSFNPAKARDSLASSGYELIDRSVGRGRDEMGSLSEYYKHPSTGTKVRLSDHEPSYVRSTGNDIFINPGSIDEAGASEAIVKGAKTRPTSKIGYGGGATPAIAAGLGALSQSDDSEASQSAIRLLQEGIAGQKSKAFNIPFPLLNKVGLTLQEFPQSLIAGGIGRGLETLSMGRENELTDDEIRSRAIDVGLDFL